MPLRGRRNDGPCVLADNNDTLVDELRKRCPGFSTRRYRKALAHAFFLTR